MLIPDYGVPVLPVGKFKGLPVDQVMKVDPKYFTGFIFIILEMDKDRLMLEWKKVHGGPPGNA